MRSRPSPLLSVLSGALILASAQAAEAQNRNVAVVLQEEPFSVEPCNANTSIIGKVLKQNIVETLVEVDSIDGSIRPRLATSWQPVDNLTWRFKLREGVKFHDGSDFNAAAVVYAVNRTLDTAIDCEVRIKVFGGFKMTLKAVDSHTVDVVTDKPQPILPTMFAPLTIMSPKTKMGVVATHPVGTGPYEFVDWKHGQEINLKRFAGYWGAKPQVEAAKYVWRNESSVRAAMVATGEADLAPSISEQDANKPELDVSYPNSETVRLRIDLTKEPLTDRRVREALNLAIDRQGLIGGVFSKDVQHATQLVLPSINGHNGDIPVWPYDPTRAKALLEAAKKDGIPVDRDIQIIGRIGVYPNSAESMEAVMGMLRAVGFNVSLKMMEVAEHVRFLQKPWPAVGPNLQQDQHDNNNGDAVFTVFYKYGSGGANSKLSDPRLDRVIERASSAVGYERRRLWQQAFEIINLDIVADIPLFHMVGYARVGKRISFTPNITTNTQVDLEKITFN